jgi:NADPH-dependent glutamate synthase beta subunit-like oxidoreductase
MLRVGLPEHRLPKSLVEAEVQHLLNMGLDLQTSHLVTPTEFQRIGETFDAVFIASGSHRPRQLRVKGEDLEGVIHAITFLREVALGAKPKLGRVVVIGGGGVAIDAARVAVRLGAEVQMFCLESRDEIPGHEWELQMTFAEGVSLEPSCGVKEITGKKHVDGVILKQCTQVFDVEGRFNPIYNEDVTKRVDADTVILAIGQSPELSYLEGIDVARGVIVDPYTLQTNRPHVYAGGDVVRGVGSFLEAVLDGTLAAQSIMNTLVEPST